MRDPQVPGRFRGRDLLLVGSIVFAAALVGIYTRQAGFLAAFWPANSILIGLFARRPALARPAGWAAAAAAYLAADLLTGGALDLTLWLTVGNLISVGGTLLVLRRLDIEDLSLRRPYSILHVFLACLAGAVATGVTGAWIGFHYYGMSLGDAYLTWLASELASSMAIVPVILAAPRTARLIALARAVAGPQPWRTLGAFAILVLSLVAGYVVSGPAALTFPVPALLLCALSTDVFRTTLFTLVSTVWTMIALVSDSLLLLDVVPTDRVILSVQVGMSLIAMGPIAVAANLVSRDEQFRRLLDSASRDSLTDALSRGTFFERGEAVIEELARSGRPVAVMMMDLDHFKRVNDLYGHAVGDRVLKRFVEIASGCIRDSDLFGRIGGEEFAIILPGVYPGMADIVAQRICALFAESEVDHTAGTVSVTVSIGIAHAVVTPSSLDLILAAADRALYAAKRRGRNGSVAVDVQPAAS